MPPRPPSQHFRRRLVGDRVYFEPLDDYARALVRSIRLRMVFDEFIGALIDRVEEVVEQPLFDRTELVMDPWRSIYSELGFVRRPFLRYDASSAQLWMPVEEFQETGEDLPGG